MKEIIAIIRMAKMGETKKALIDAGLPSFNAPGKVQGRGKGALLGTSKPVPAVVHEEDSEEFDALVSRLKTKRMIDLVVTDEKVDLAIETILKVNHTGQSGDGKIFVLPAMEAYQVRTAESGNKVLD